MAGTKPSVLILDDDLLALELYLRELQGSYQVVTRKNAAEARNLLTSEIFDILIIEPAVNDGEGWSLLKEIQALARPPRVILCSVEDDRKTGLEQGADAFILKPVLMPVLRNLLEQMSNQITPHKLPNYFIKAERGK